MNSYTFWIIIFGIIGYLIVTDNSVAKAFYMISQLIRIRYEKIKWWILHNPKNPIVKYMMWRRAYKLAEEFQKKFAEKEDKV